MHGVRGHSFRNADKSSLMDGITTHQFPKTIQPEHTLSTRLPSWNVPVVWGALPEQNEVSPYAPTSSAD